MKKTYVLAILSIVIFLVGSFVWAKGSNADTKENNQRSGKQAEIRNRATATELKENNRKEIENLRQEFEQQKEELRVTIEQKREELKNKIEQKREDLKKGLEKIKDEKKKDTVEKIDKQLDELNKRTLDHYLNVLDKLGEMLVRISERADRAEKRGVDVSTVRTAIDAAKKSIAAAKTAVETQSGKTYTIKIMTENTLKVDVKKARQALHNDLTVVRLAVKAAHEAVRDAATTLAKLPRPKQSPETSETPTPTPTGSQ